MTNPSHADTPTQQDMDNFDQHEGHLQDWSRELMNMKAPAGLTVEDIIGIQELNMDRNETYKRLEKMELPTLAHVSCSLPDFMSQPDKYLEDFRDCKVRLVVEPHSLKAELPTIRLTDPDHTEIVAALGSKIPEDYQTAYAVLVKEYIPFAYRVTIIVNSDQSVLLEAANPASQSFQLNGIPDYRANRDPMLGTYRYDFENPGLRRLFYNAILKVPYIGSGRHREFQTGYYEMIIARRNENDSFEFYFDDYRKGKGFNQ